MDGCCRANVAYNLSKSITDCEFHIWPMGAWTFSGIGNVASTDSGAVNLDFSSRFRSFLVKSIQARTYGMGTFKDDSI